VTVDPEGGVARVGAREFTFPKLPPEILEIREAGGLLPWTRRQLETNEGGRK
jgi:hypothetical protein